MGFSHHPQGDWRLRVLSGLYKQEFNGICSVHPVFKAHLRCAPS
jgi:hypothetical protein